MKDLKEILHESVVNESMFRTSYILKDIKFVVSPGINDGPGIIIGKPFKVDDKKGYKDTEDLIKYLKVDDWVTRSFEEAVELYGHIPDALFCYFLASDGSAEWTIFGRQNAKILLGF